MQDLAKFSPSTSVLFNVLPVQFGNMETLETLERFIDFYLNIKMSNLCLAVGRDFTQRKEIVREYCKQGDVLVAKPALTWQSYSAP